MIFKKENSKYTMYLLKPRTWILTTSRLLASTQHFLALRLRRQAPGDSWQTHKVALVRQMGAAPEQGRVVVEPAPCTHGPRIQVSTLPCTSTLFLTKATDSPGPALIYLRLI